MSMTVVQGNARQEHRGAGQARQGKERKGRPGEKELSRLRQGMGVRGSARHGRGRKGRGGTQMCLSGNAGLGWQARAGQRSRQGKARVKVWDLEVVVRAS